jgi:hypothetical protein
MKPLTARERQVVSVAVDLLMKGNPATRIAQYCIRLKMTKEQVRNLSQKLADKGFEQLAGNLPYCMWLLETNKDDDAISQGKRLSLLLTKD